MEFRVELSDNINSGNSGETPGEISRVTLIGFSRGTFQVTPREIPEKLLEGSPEEFLEGIPLILFGESPMTLFEKCLTRYDRIYVNEVFLVFQTQESIDYFRSLRTIRSCDCDLQHISIRINLC